MLGGCGGGSGGSGSGSGTTSPPKPVTPQLTSLSPASAPVGSPAFTLTVNGAGFAPGGSLSWNGTDLGPYNFVSATQVTIGIGAARLTSQGRNLVVAKNTAPDYQAVERTAFHDHRVFAIGLRAVRHLRFLFHGL